MAASILDGKSLAQTMQAEIAEEVIDFIQNYAAVPTLAAVLVGDDPASVTYVGNKRKACERVGIDSQLHHLRGDTTEEDVLTLLARLNKDSKVHGILVQLPLPPHVDPLRIQQSVSPIKDIDALHPENVGRLVQGRPRFLPCTPHGIQRLLLHHGVIIEGSHTVILGRSEIVGKPLAILLSGRGPGADATVTLCHSRTRSLSEITRRADILVIAIGRPRFVTRDMVKPGAVVVDVGIHRTPEGLVGDVDFPAVQEIAGMITPVPGGIGPLTVSMLLHNTLKAAREQEA